MVYIYVYTPRQNPHTYEIKENDKTLFIMEKMIELTSCIFETVSVSVFFPFYPKPEFFVVDFKVFL